MFIQHSVHIKKPFDLCTSAFERGPQTWFPGLDSSAEAGVGLHVAGVPVRKRVELRLEAPSKHGSWVEIPFTWKATTADQLFPEMIGKLELAPVDPELTRLTVSGMYSPPLGKLGRGIDDAVMHKVAEATVKELAKAIAAQVEIAFAPASKA
jgi:hypothetical protein